MIRLLLVSGLLGCAGSTDPITTDDPMNPTDGGGGPTIIPGPVGTAALSGMVSLEDGTPVQAADIRFCLASGVCRFGETDASGAYSFGEVDEVWHSFEVRPPLEGPYVGYAIGLVPLIFAENETRTVDMPLLQPSATPLPAAPAEIEVVPGLFVTIGTDVLEPPTFEEPATEVSGAVVPEDQWPSVDAVEGTVLGMWFLGPFDHHSEAGLPVRMNNDWELPLGEEYEVWVASYGDALWIEAGNLTVTEAGLEGDASLPLVSTIILVDPA